MVVWLIVGVQPNDMLQALIARSRFDAILSLVVIYSVANSFFEAMFIFQELLFNSSRT